jgi:hypothetical protein
MPYVVTCPFWQFVDHWQTLITGVFALCGGGVAFLGAIRAANIQAQAGREQTQANFELSRKRDAALRDEEINNISNAIRREIIVLSEILINQLKILAAIKCGQITVTRNHIRSVIMNPEPIIYKAVANRIGILPYPVVQFYMRLVEIQDAVQIIAVGPDGEDAPVPGAEAQTTAKSVIVACQLARSIIQHAPKPSVDEEIARITLVHIDEALKRAKQSFPELLPQSRAV